MGNLPKVIELLVDSAESNRGRELSPVQVAEVVGTIAGLANSNQNLQQRVDLAQRLVVTLAAELAAEGDTVAISQELMDLQTERFTGFRVTMALDGQSINVELLENRSPYETSAIRVPEVSDDSAGATGVYREPSVPEDGSAAAPAEEGLFYAAFIDPASYVGASEEE